MTFSEQIVNAMLKPSKYKDILKLKKGRHILFIIVMMLVLSIVAFVVPTAATIAGFGGFEKLFAEKLPPLEYKNGTLEIEKKFEMGFGVYNVIIDTSVAGISNDMLDRDGINIAIGSKDVRVVIVYGDKAGEQGKMSLAGLLFDGFNNESLVNMIPTIYVALFISTFFVGIGFFVKYGIFALILAIWTNSINKYYEMGLYFSEVFMVCFYGMTFGYIVSNFNAALGLFSQTIVSIVTVFISMNIISSAFYSFRKDIQV